MKIKKEKLPKAFYFSIGILLLILVTVGILLLRAGTLKKEMNSHIFKTLALSGTYPFRRLIPILKKIPEKVLSGEYPVAFETLSIDIKQKDMDAMEVERQQFLKQGIAYKPKERKAFIHYKNSRMKVSIRLKGMLKDHWEESYRWSFKIKMEGKNSLHGYEKFNLSIPRARQYPYDFVFRYALKEFTKMPTPHFELFQVYVNGDHWGVMALEQMPDKIFLETEKQKESFVLRFSNPELTWTNHHINKSIGVPIKGAIIDYSQLIDLSSKNKIAESEAQLKGLSYFYKANNAVKYGEMDAAYLFNTESYGNAFLWGLISNDIHLIHPSNLRNFFNPYTLQMYAIPMDSAPPCPVGHHIRSPYHLPKQLHPFRVLIKNKQYIAYLKLNIPKLSDALPAFERNLDKSREMFPLEDFAPHFIEQITANINFAESHGIEKLSEVAENIELNTRKKMKASDVNIVPRGAFIPEHIDAYYYRSGRLRIHNLIKQPIVLKKVVFSSSSGEKPTVLFEGPKTLPAGTDGVVTAFIDLQLPKLDIGEKQPITIYTQINSDPIKETKLIFNLYENMFNPMLSVPKLTDSLTEFPYIELSQKAFTVKSGNWDVNRPIIVPKGYTLDISPGTTLRFSSDAYLLTLGRLRTLGTESKRVILKPKGLNWKGIYALETDEEQSVLKYTDIQGTTYFEAGALALTGGVTFYNSDVTMNNVRFIKTHAEDMLNIVHSNMSIEGCTFDGSQSDAFDSDYCTGTISNSTFKNIGGDGIDTSGSNVNIKNISFRLVKDKAISAGEGSTLTVDTVKSDNTGTCIAVKDGSLVNAKNIKYTNSILTPLMVYSKKTFYGTATLNIDGDVVPGDITLQKGNTCRLNGTLVKAAILDVNSLYEEGPMKK